MPESSDLAEFKTPEKTGNAAEESGDENYASALVQVRIETKKLK